MNGWTSWSPNCFWAFDNPGILLNLKEDQYAIALISDSVPKW